MSTVGCRSVGREHGVEQITDMQNIHYFFLNYVAEKRHWRGSTKDGKLKFLVTEAEFVITEPEL